VLSAVRTAETDASLAGNKAGNVQVWIMQVIAQQVPFPYSECQVFVSFFSL